MIEATLDVVKDMIGAGCNLFTVNVAANQGLYVPWGWVAAEKVLNGETHTGIRWMSFLDSATPSFKAMSALLLPQETAKLKAGTAAAFLAKVIGHLDAGVGAKDQIKKMKEEQVDRKRSALDAANEEVRNKQAKMIKQELSASARSSNQ